MIGRCSEYDPAIPLIGTESPYAVRDDKSSRPVETRVSICRIGRIEFIAVSDPLRSSAILELLNKPKIEITGHTKDVSDPDLVQSPQQEITGNSHNVSSPTRQDAPKCERQLGLFF
jgi:hypothetical protein